MNRNFNNKVIVITGASGNLGKAIAIRLAKAGAKIAALDYDEVALKALDESLNKKGMDILSITCDITNKKACFDATTKIMSHWGHIDGLVNNAGITHIQRYTDMPKKKGITRKVMEVNFFGAVNCTEAMLDQIRINRGIIVNISSVAGFAPLLGRTAYAASKHALHGFFESLGAELQDEGVHCLMVCPSFIQAPTDVASNPSAAKNSIYQDKKTIGPSISADDIAENIYKSCIREKKILIMGRTGKLSYIMRRFVPSIYERMMIKNLKNDI